jgi:DNA-3-methyladenine glycosylase II
LTTSHQDAAPIQAIAAADPRLAAFMERAGPYEARPGQGDPFTSLARAIVFQQLAGRAAAAIYGRFATTVGGSVTPDAILGTAPEALRAAGLSGNKKLSLIDLATKVREGTVPLEGIEAFDDEEIIARLGTVRGIGRWTAEMFLMFRLHRPDVLPVGDLGIVKAVQRAYKLRTLPSPERLTKIGETWRPYRSVACWYLWASLQAAPLKTTRNGRG